MKPVPPKKRKRREGNVGRIAKLLSMESFPFKNTFPALFVDEIMDEMRTGNIFGFCLPSYK
jgi:hypothetical protein